MKRFAALLLLLILACQPAIAETEAPEAAVRKGTLVVRIPREWLIEQIDTGVISGNSWFPDGTQFYDYVEMWADIQQIVRGYLGTGVAPFLEDCRDGEAETYEGYWALGYPLKYSAIMTQQSMNDAYYTITRLGKDKTVDHLFCDGSHYFLSMKDGIFHREEPVYGCVELDILPENLDALQPVFYSESGDCHVSLYRVFDENLAVLTVPDVDEDMLWNASLRIDGGEPDSVIKNNLTGYRSKGNNAVYCLFVSPEEAGRIMQGAEIQMEEAE